MFEINFRPPNTKPGTFGWYECLCSNCGLSAEKTIKLQAFNEEGERSISCQAEICIECLKQAIQHLEEK